jgi:hypothetical protein
MPATATVKGGFWPQNGVNSLVSIDGRNSARKAVAMNLGDRGQLQLRELIRALLGVAPGGTATKALTRIVAAVELGGKRLIESVNLINRVSTAGDVTAITADYLSYTTKTTFGATPPVNKDNNPLGTR